MLPGLSIIAAVCADSVISSSTEIGEESRKYGGTVGDGRRDEQQPSRAFPQIGNGRDNQSNDNERNGKGEEIAEQPVEGDEYTCDGNGQELSQRDTCRYGDEDLPQEGNPKFFHNADAFSKNRKIFPFCQGNAALSFTEVLDLNR